MECMGRDAMIWAWSSLGRARKRSLRVSLNAKLAKRVQNDGNYTYCKGAVGSSERIC